MSADVNSLVQCGADEIYEMLVSKLCVFILKKYLCVKLFLKSVPTIELNLYYVIFKNFLLEGGIHLRY